MRLSVVNILRREYPNLKWKYDRSKKIWTSNRGNYVIKQGIWWQYNSEWEVSEIYKSIQVYIKWDQDKTYFYNDKGYHQEVLSA